MSRCIRNLTRLVCEARATALDDGLEHRMAVRKKFEHDPLSIEVICPFAEAKPEESGVRPARSAASGGGKRYEGYHNVGKLSESVPDETETHQVW